MGIAEIGAGLFYVLKSIHCAEITFYHPGVAFYLPGMTFYHAGISFYLPEVIFYHPGITFYLPEMTFYHAGMTFYLPEMTFYLAEASFYLAGMTFYLAGISVNLVWTTVELPSTGGRLVIPVNGCLSFPGIHSSIHGLQPLAILTTMNRQINQSLKRSTSFRH